MREEKLDDTILSMHNVSMAFDGAVALRNVDFVLKRGEIRGLVGKNGAGKSTLVKILMGIHTPQDGKIVVDGKTLSRDESVKQREHYVSAIFQEFSLIPDLTVKQNVFFNAEPRIGLFINDRRCSELTMEFFESFGIDIDPDMSVRDLNTAEMQLVEITKAVLKNKRILIMDEPTAALEQAQKDRLFDLMRKLKSSGVSIVFISHYLDDVMAVCDSISILRDGLLVMSSGIGETTIDEVIDKIVGEEKVDLLRRRNESFADYHVPLLTVDFRLDPSMNGMPPITVHKGEVLGLAGLKGSGTETIIGKIYGTLRTDGVRVTVDGKPIRLRNPSDAVVNGVSLIPENRQVQGVFLTQSILFNITLPILRFLRRLFLIDDRAARKKSDELVERLQIKTSDVRLPAKSLSGGNQQKVVFAKSVSTMPRVILMDDPTFGVDVHAKSEIIKITAEFVRAGNGVIMVSSDYEELLQNCDRILVVKDGKISQEFKNVQFSQIKLSELTKAIEV